MDKYEHKYNKGGFGKGRLCSQLIPIEIANQRSQTPPSPLGEGEGEGEEGGGGGEDLFLCEGGGKEANFQIPSNR